MSVILANKYKVWDETDENYRKYFRARDRAAIGCMGNSYRQYELDEFHRVDLTTKLSVKNTFKDMRVDFQALNRWLRRDRGLNVEYCVIPELSPKNDLVHLHGCYRSNDFECLTDLHYWPTAYEISKKWEQYHGAVRVEFEAVWDTGLNLWIGYMCKHMAKQYPYSSEQGLRVMTSHGWLPENFELARSLICKNTKRMIEEGAEVNASWLIADELVRDWSAGRMIDCLNVNGRKFELKAQTIFFEGVRYGIKDFVLCWGLKISK